MKKLDMQKIRKDFEKALSKGKTILERMDILTNVMESVYKNFPKKEADDLQPKLMVMWGELEKKRSPTVDKIYNDFNHGLDGDLPKSS